MKLLSRLSVLGLIAVMVALFSGCKNPPANNEDSIRTLLGTSDYTNDDQSGTTDDGTTDPQQGGGFGTLGFDQPTVDTLPWVRFARKIERPVPRRDNNHDSGLSRVS